MTVFEYGFVAHLVADWLLQNDWMARNKGQVTHIAAWIHAAIHAVMLGLALGAAAGLLLAVVHLLIDTRLPLGWWRKFFKQTADGHNGQAVAIWADQSLHILCLAVAVIILER